MDLHDNVLSQFSILSGILFSVNSRKNKTGILPNVIKLKNNRVQKAGCSYRRNRHNVRFPQTNQTVCGNFHFTSRRNGLSKPSPAGEGGRPTSTKLNVVLTDEVLSLWLKIAIVQLKMFQYILCNRVEIISYIIVGIS